MNALNDHSEIVEPHILVADDESDIRELICEILANENYNVAPFDPNSPDEHVLHMPYDVVILDIFMPKYNGFTLREKVMEHSPHAQFIVITGQPDSSMIERVTKLGIYGFLTKPFTVEQIRYTVMGAVRMRKFLRKSPGNDDNAATKKIDLIGALRRIDAIVNCMGEGLLAIDNDNAVALMNGVAEKITGMRFGECAGVRLDRCNARTEVKEYLLSRLAETAAENKENALTVHIDGADARYYTVNMQDVRNESGERVGRVVLFVDRTDAKHMEALRDSFLSVAAHELRTPIAVMMNYLCLLRKKDNDREMRTIAIEDMLSASRRMKYLVNSIINFVMLSGRDVSVYKTAVDIGSIIRGEMKKIENEAREKNLTFEVTKSLASARFFSDPDLVTIAVYNVLNNAVKYNRENGAVRIDIKNRVISGEPGIVIHVDDEGEGLSPQVAGTLFESFTQGEEHLTRIHSGLGTGLFLAQRAVRLLGGFLRAEPLPGRGSRFSLELPCSRTVAATREISTDIQQS
ncbi:MAG: response regulator [Chitinispirillaceae bacterium]|nr:response regulator [Chitinispirillaceae bacterium]